MIVLHLFPVYCAFLFLGERRSHTTAAGGKRRENETERTEETTERER